MTFGIAREKAPGGRKSAMMANASEDIEHFSLLRQGMTDSIGREQGQVQCLGDFERRLIAHFFFSAKVPLQFDIDILATEYFTESAHACGRAFDSALSERMCERPFFASRKANKPPSLFGNFFGRHVAFALSGAQFHARDQAAKILVSHARFYEQWITPAETGCNFGADVSSNGNFCCGKVETGSAVNAVAVEQGDSPHSAFRTHPRQFFRQGCAFKKTERGARVKLDVHQS
jgi:hypothetical protein